MQRAPLFQWSARTWKWSRKVLRLFFLMHVMHNYYFIDYNSMFPNFEIIHFEIIYLFSLLK